MNTELVVALPFAVQSGQVLYYFERDDALNTAETEQGASLDEAARLWAEASCPQFKGYKTYFYPQGTFSVVAILGGLRRGNTSNWHAYTAVQELRLPDEHKALITGICAGIEEFDWSEFEHLNSWTDAM